MRRSRGRAAAFISSTVAARVCRTGDRMPPPPPADAPRAVLHQPQLPKLHASLWAALQRQHLGGGMDQQIGIHGLTPGAARSEPYTAGGKPGHSRTVREATRSRTNKSNTANASRLSPAPAPALASRPN